MLYFQINDEEKRSLFMPSRKLDFRYLSQNPSLRSPQISPSKLFRAHGRLCRQKQCGDLAVQHQSRKMRHLPKPLCLSTLGRKSRGLLDDRCEEEARRSSHSDGKQFHYRAFCKTQANSSSDIASLHDDWILVSTLHDSLDLAAKFRPDSTKNPFKPSKRV